MALTVKELLKDKSADLRLKIVAGTEDLAREITVSEINRPGLALGGFLDNFRWERIQVIGRGEQAYLRQLVAKKSKESLRDFLNYKMPCLIFTHQLEPPPELAGLAKEFHVPLLVSGLGTATLIAEISTYLEEKLSPTVSLHGVLVDLYGLGVLISGDSGIGKSECALELVKRGHLLVADDVIKVQHRSGGVLIGRPASEMMQHHLEVRGVGIINVRELFGVSAILDMSRIELAVHLEMWDQAKEYDRMGMEDHSLEILGVRIPRIILPVRPGRNLAVLIEVAALYQRLKAKGINTAQQIEQNLLQMLSQQASPQGAAARNLRGEGGARHLREGSGRAPYRRR